MKIDVESERVNRLLHRTEMWCNIDTDGTTPSRKEIIQQIAAKKGVKEELVVVDKIDQEFGKKVAKAYVKVYESEKAAQGIEPDYRHERAKKAMEEKPKAEEKPAEEAAPAAEETKGDAAPVEEKKDEQVAEEKAGEPEKPEESKAEEKKEEAKPEEKEAPKPAEKEEPKPEEKKEEAPAEGPEKKE